MSTALRTPNKPDFRQPARLTRFAPVQDLEYSIPLPVPFKLDYLTLEQPVDIKARLVGPRHAPVILALGGISANRHVCDAADGSEGWWSDLVGAGKTINTREYRVLSFDFFPGDNHLDTDKALSITPTDQARIAAAICDHLGIAELHAFIGASYGGMVALGFGLLFPEKVKQLVVLCAAHRAHPLGTAWRSIQRKIVRFGLETGQPDRALSLARELGMTTYRTAAEFRHRFSSTPDSEGEHRFEVDGYLETRGQAFIGRMSPARYLSLSESIDLHELNPAHITVPTTLIGFSQDQLVAIEEVQALFQQLPQGVGCFTHNSIYGHDAFLKETDFITGIVENVLKASQPFYSFSATVTK